MIQITAYVLISAAEYNALAELLRRTPVTQAEGLAIEALLNKWASALEDEVAKAQQVQTDHTSIDQAVR